MSEHIVGDWKDFTFKMLTLEDLDLVTDHVRVSFLRNESMNVLLGWSEENAEDHDRLVACALSHGLSFAVFTKDGNELVGINLILNGQKEGLKSITPKSIICQKIDEFLGKLDEVCDEAFRNNFDHTNYAEILITSVANNYGGKGIASEMYRRTFKFLKAKGFQTVKSGFSSPGTRAIGDKLGFSEIGRIYFKHYVNKSGEHDFPSATEDQYVKEVAKTL